MRRITVRVPASTSNLGPGFDCLGLALRIYNDVTVARSRRRNRIAMTQAAAAKFFKATALTSFPFSCKICGEVPASRGLGSSVIVRLGTLIGLNELSGRPLRRDELFAICAELEGHPDNAAPAAFGGFNVITSGDRQRFAVSQKLRIVLLIPDFEVRTKTARRLLPHSVGHGEAVRNAANVAGIVAAFASENYRHLRGAFADSLHEPFRKHLVPSFEAVVAAAEKAGALGAFLSGSGSTIAAITLNNPKTVADAMLAAMRKSKGARVVITSADNRGARIVRTTP